MVRIHANLLARRTLFVTVEFERRRPHAGAPSGTVTIRLLLEQGDVRSHFSVVRYASRDHYGAEELIGQGGEPLHEPLSALGTQARHVYPPAVTITVHKVHQVAELAYRLCLPFDHCTG